MIERTKSRPVDSVPLPICGVSSPMSKALPILIMIMALYLAYEYLR
jgi:hypothetical protein